MSGLDAFEVNFDGLIGPTHNYSGLSYGNIASIAHQSLISNPREAALQGLKKMKYLADLGLKQAILPPQERPHLNTLRSLGFNGTDSQVLEEASRVAPKIFLACCSASNMWTANAATVSPSADSADRKLHLTPANLVSNFHRSLEHVATSKVLKAIFNKPEYYVHHSALPHSLYFSDEGGANHSRFCRSYGERGIQLFVYGRSAFNSSIHESKKFPARQTWEASNAIARLHQLDSETVVYAQQTPEAIDAGAFHNDVVSVGNCNLFFFHERAFVSQREILQELNRKYNKISGGDELIYIEVPSSKVSLSDAVASYLFNSQIIRPSHQNKMIMIAPSECQEIDSVKHYLDSLIHNEASPFERIEYFDLRQSMRNGGGPACLRLRIVLTQEELQNINTGVFLTDNLFAKLTQWIQLFYRDRLALVDLSDPKFMEENRTALDQLTQILRLGSIYTFQ